MIITGQKGIGKSTLCYKVIGYLQNLNIKVGGVITLQNDEKSFYLIGSKLKIPFEAKENESYIQIGRFRIHRENLDRAISSIQSSLESQFLFLDEIGILELQGQGYYPILSSVVLRGKTNIFVVKEKILDEFQKIYPRTQSYQVIHVNNQNLDYSLTVIKNLIDKHLMDLVRNDSGFLKS